MFERFTERARKVFLLANQEAQRFNHEYVGPEHVLIALVKEGNGCGANVLRNLGVDLPKIRVAVEGLVRPGPDMVSMGKLPLTDATKKVVETAISEARSLNNNYVGTEHILLGLIGAGGDIVTAVLQKFDLTTEHIREKTSSLLRPSIPDNDTKTEASKGLLPKFLPKDLAEKIVTKVVSVVTDDSATGICLKRKACHIVVLVPLRSSSQSIVPFTLVDMSFGNKDEWTAQYDEIARNKALQLWEGRSSGNACVAPHLLFVGDTPYWGGVARGGIVIACSGVQPYFDRMIAGVIADMLIGYAHHLFATNNDLNKGVDFVV